MVAASSDGLEVLLLKLEVELFEGCMAKGRLAIADGDSRVALLNHNPLEVVDGVLALPVSLNLDVALTAHIKVLVLFPSVVSGIFKHLADLLSEYFRV